MADPTILRFSSADADAISQAYKDRYQKNYELKMQEKGNKLAPRVSLTEAAEGKKFIFDYMDDWELSQETVRANAAGTGDGTSYFDLEMNRRETAWFKYGGAAVIDETDEIAMMADPKWGVTENHAAASNRCVERAIANALFATVTGGQQSDLTFEWDSDTDDVNILAHNSEGLTSDKILEARKYLSQVYDLSDPQHLPTMLCHTDDVFNLMAEDKVQSVDYMRDKVMALGYLKDIWGVEFVTVNHIFDKVKNSSGNMLDNTTTPIYRRCAMFVKSAVAYGLPKPPKTRIGQNITKRYRWEAYADVVVGALRKYEAGVIEVQCAISPEKTTAAPSA